MKYVSKPTVIDAVQFDGTNYDEVCSELGIDSSVFNEISAEDLKYSANPDAPGELWVSANSAWLQVVPGEWILRDILGCYPCADEIFRAKYEQA